MEEAAPYSPLLRRFTAMVLKEVKLKGEFVMRITVKWEEQLEDGEWDGRSRRSTQEPQDGFWAATIALVAPVMQVLNLPDDYSFNTAVAELKASYDDDDNQIVSAKFRKNTKAGPIVFETPPLAESGNYAEQGLMSPEMKIAVGEMEKRVLDYAAGKNWKTQESPQMALEVQ